MVQYLDAILAIVGGTVILVGVVIALGWLTFWYSDDNPPHQKP